MSNDSEGKIKASQDEDLELVRRSQQGDLRAFEGLVERHQKKMIHLAFRMTGDYEEACDLAQEAFLSAFRALRTFRGEARFSSWLYGIVLNRTRTRLQQIAARRRFQPLSLDDPSSPGTGSETVDPPAMEASALEQMEKKEIENKIQECIGRLDYEFREPLVLRDILGHSYGEVSALLRVPEGTVKSRLFRARLAMKDCLKKLLGDL
ncbi:MAG: RNA polymerase sigma factor [Deltaproteobacteria bacterium]|nr:RNA polymerase sigma factor [Deltaproteobacteria bacterium]